MNYKIITDEQKLIEFINWLPDLEKHETFYVCLFARSKYITEETSRIVHIRSDKAQLKRFTSSKDLLFSKIKQLECEVGSYKQRGNPIPQECLAIYITPNPRDMIKATKNTLVKFANLVTQNYNGHNPHQEVMSEIQKAKSRTVFIDFDFDGYNSVEVKSLIQQFDSINIDACTFVETRGGCHLLIDPLLIDEAHKKIFYNKLTSLPGVDINGDCMLPIVGCHQGGFTPHFVV